MIKFFLNLVYRKLKKILSPISALHIFHNSFKASSLKNFPTGPLALIALSFSNVKYAKPDAPCSLAHLSIIIKKTSRFIFCIFCNYSLTLAPLFN